LNTAVRPPSEDFAAALTKEQMTPLTHLFEPPAEMIAEFTSGSKQLQVNTNSIFAMLQRRPCTSAHIENAFGMHVNEVAKYLGRLLRNDQIRAEHRNRDVFYVAVNKR
jgi:hypothetical protein